MTDFGHPIETLRISPGRLDIEVVAGDDVAFDLAFVNVDPNVDLSDPNHPPVETVADISTEQFAGEVRKHPDEPSVAYLECRYKTDGTDGVLTVRSDVPIAEWGSYRYDIEAYGPTGTRTVIAGSLYAHKETTS